MLAILACGGCRTLRKPPRKTIKKSHGKKARNASSKWNIMQHLTATEASATSSSLAAAAGTAAETASSWSLIDFCVYKQIA